jgi:hypothetical protein
MRRLRTPINNKEKIAAIFENLISRLDTFPYSELIDFF